MFNKKLVKRMDELENKSKNNEENLDKLKNQVSCGISGHEFKFIRYSKYWDNYYNLIDNEDYGVFKCTKCDVEISRKLTVKEKKALKTLGG